MDHVGGGGTAIAAAIYAIKKAKDVFGNPLSYIRKIIKHPAYEDRVAFIERFQQDFAHIVKSYIGDTGRVFVFIDDLDRCDVPRAADLMQAINLLLSTESANLFFILGLDREMVAAGLAAKYEKVIPYLAAARAAPGSKPDNSKTGMDYGFSFMDKFIQVPFRVPGAQDAQISSWIETLVGGKSENKFDKRAVKRGGDGFAIKPGLDPEGVEKIVRELAPVFRFNPRKLKQFVNVFRLRLMVAVLTDMTYCSDPDK